MLTNEKYRILLATSSKLSLEKIVSYSMGIWDKRSWSVKLGKNSIYYEVNE
jgi:hypothetical protein